MAMVVVLAAGWVAFPERSGVARSELRHLEGQWREAQVLDAGRLQVINQLDGWAAPSPVDQARVEAATAALWSEQAAHLRAIRARVHGYLLVDRGLTRLRAAMDHAVSLRETDADADRRFWAQARPFGLPPPPSPSSVAAASAVDRLLSEQLHHWGLRAEPKPTPPVFHAAGPILAILNRISDSPTGSRLIVDTSTGLLVLDIDANRITVPNLSGLPSQDHVSLVLTRRSYVLLRDDGPYFLIAPINLRGAVRRLTPNVGRPVPALDPDGMWVPVIGGATIEYDGTGRVLAGPVPVPDGATLEGATAAGLVVAYPFTNDTQPTLAVIPTAPPSPARVITHRAAHFLAAGGDLVVWMDLLTEATGIAHVTNLATGSDRTVTAGSDLVACGTAWDIAPDASRVASTWCPANAPGLSFTPGVLTPATSQIVLAPHSVDGPPAQTYWAANSDRLFVIYSDSTQGEPQLLSYQPGTPSIDYLRLHHRPVDSIAVLSGGPVRQ